MICLWCIGVVFWIFRPVGLIMGNLNYSRISNSWGFYIMEMGGERAGDRRFAACCLSLGSCVVVCCVVLLCGVYGVCLLLYV